MFWQGLSKIQPFSGRWRQKNKEFKASLSYAKELVTWLRGKGQQLSRIPGTPRWEEKINYCGLLSDFHTAHVCHGKRVLASTHMGNERNKKLKEQQIILFCIC